MKPTIQIDGSFGEGGGQILRTALGLSMLTGLPFQIEKIRAGRKKPGLLRQHLTCVNAAAAICSANTDGAVIGSQSVSFKPGPVKAGSYTFSIGTAGSTTLVLQTVLPALLTADSPSTLILEGGTHNAHAPPFDFLIHAFLPLINRMGPTVSATMDRAGFYPAGGGRIVVDIQSAKKLSPLHLTERGESLEKLAAALVAALPGDIATRELQKVQERLGWSGDQLQIRQLPRDQGPGNVVVLRVASQNVTEIFTGFGSKGISAEAVADEAITEARAYLAADVPVGPHLADQLMIPLALAGSGSFRTLSLTPHSTTNSQVIGRFLPVCVEITNQPDGTCTVDVTTNS